MADPFDDILSWLNMTPAEPKVLTVAEKQDLTSRLVPFQPRVPLDEELAAQVQDQAEAAAAQLAFEQAREDAAGMAARADEFPMARLMTRQEAAQQDLAGLNSVYGEAPLLEELEQGNNPIFPGPGGVMPAGDADTLFELGGFSEPTRDKGGGAVGPPQTFTTPATHTPPQSNFTQDEFLSSQYDFRVSRGEKLPPFEEWRASQVEQMRPQ